MSPENEWPFDIPKHWAWSSLGAIAEIKGGITKDQKRKVEGGRLVPYLRVANVQRGYLDLSEVKEIEATEEIIRELKLEDGDVLFTEGGDRDKLGRGWVWREEIHECIHQNHIFRARVLDPGISPKLVSWYSNAFGQPYFMKEGKQTTNLASVNLTKLKVFPVPIPPTEEQGRLIAKIEELSTKLDAGVEALKKAQALLKRYRASVLKAACEGRLVPTEAELARREGRDYEPADKLLARILKERREAWEAAELVKLARKGAKVKGDAWKKKYQEPAAPNTDELPELPEGWVWATVEQVAEVGTGATPKRGQPKYYSGGVIPWITSGALNDLYVYRAKEFITEAAVAETNAKIFPKHTLLIAMYGEGKTRGKISELLIGAATNQACAALMLYSDSEIIRGWVKLYFLKYYHELRNEASGGVQPNLNLEIIKKMLIPLPPLHEQERIVEEAQRLASVIDHTESETSNHQKLSNYLRQSILSAAYRGKLVPQDPNDEPASVLLERIKAARAQAAPARKTTRARRASSRS